MAKQAKAPKTAPTAAQGTTPAVGIAYTLNPATVAKYSALPAPMPTLQYTQPKHGLGMAWRQPQHKAPNTRHGVIMALVAAFGAKPFSLLQAQQAIKAAGCPLNSGTPASYCKAFVANGYFVAVPQ